MVEILGQDNLMNKIRSKTLDTFPRSLILNGEKGSGKHLISNFISEHLDIPLIDITESISVEMLQDINEKPYPCLYLVDSDSKKFSIRQQNAILKFLEEPLLNAYIIVLCENIDTLIETIKNRCQVWNILPYSKEILARFIETSDNNLILSIARTPGRVKEIKAINLSDIFDLCYKLIDKISVASYPNTLSISNKISFDDAGPIPLYLFIECLLYSISERQKQGMMVPKYFYDLTLQLNREYKIKNLDRKYIFERFLTNLWQGAHS